MIVRSPYRESLLRGLTADHLDLCVVVPTYNSKGHLTEWLSLLVRLMEDCSLSYSIVLIDDGSTPDQRADFKQIISCFPHVIVCELNENMGQHFATLWGLRMMSNASLLLTLDDDKLITAEELLQGIQLIQRSDVDLVFLVHEQSNRPLLRNLATASIRRLVAIAAGRSIQGLSSSRLLLGEVAQKLVEPDRRHYIAVELLRAASTHAAIRVGNAPEIRNSNYTISKLLHLAARLVSSYPFQFAKALAKVALGASFASLAFLASSFSTTVWPPSPFPPGAYTAGAILGMIGILLMAVAVALLRRARRLHNATNSRRWSRLEVPATTIYYHDPHV